ncbi:MAG: transposase family protein [Sandaracinaceae bacterium]|nr:transposase family protein [Sandaracinaceae bacterium]
MTLTYSRMQFIWPTFEQTTEAVCEGLDAAWTFFGGLVARVLVDNASAMVTSPHPTSPRVNDAFADYAQHRDFFVDTTRVRHPKDKPRVENQMPFVRESWWDGESIADLDEARRSAEVWAAGWQSASTERPSAWCASTTRQRRSRSCCRLPRSRSTCRFGPKRRCIRIITFRCNARCTRCRRASSAGRCAFVRTVIWCASISPRS